MNEYRTSLPCWYCGCETPHTTLQVLGVTVIDCDACGAGEIAIEPLAHHADNGPDPLLQWIPRTRYALPPDRDPIPQAFLDAFAP